MTSEARARPRAEDDAETVGVADPRAETTTAEEPSIDDAPIDAVADETAGPRETVDQAVDQNEAGAGRTRLSGRRTNAAAAADADDEPRAARLSVPVVPVLAGLLVLLLAATAFLWFTRPDPSSVRTADYVQVLEAARSGVVDLTSFDYLTLDDDIAQVKKIAIGDLQKESVDQLNSKRKDLTDSQAIVNTQVVGAAVTRADDSRGTAVLVIQSTQQTKASTQPTVVRYRIEVQLQKVSGRWRLSGISGR